MKKLLSIIVVIGFIANPTLLKSQQLIQNFPKTDGIIYAMCHDSINNILYLGGSFTSIGNYKLYGAQISSLTGEIIPADWSDANNTVTASVSDGNGGWYIGGSFTQVGDSLRNYIAHLDPTGHVTAWNPNANAQVRQLTLEGTTLYAAGNFTNIGGQDRRYLAALDITMNTNNATGWDPNPNDIVNTIAVSGNIVYTGGEFDTIGGERRIAIAALDANTNINNATPWNPNESGSGLVNTILIHGDTVFVGGDFISIAGVVRYSLAALDATTATAFTWNPSVGSSGIVNTLVLEGTTLYVGGSFNTLGGQPRNRIGAVNITLNSGMTTAWNPNANSVVTKIAATDTRVYVAGDFTTMGGQSRKGLVALDANLNTNNVTTWNPSNGGHYATVSVFGNTVYAGGALSSIGDKNMRNNLAAIDLNTYEVTDWNPGVYGNVRAIALKGTTLYVGGQYDTIGGQPRHNLASVNTTLNTNNATDWNPAPQGSTIYSIAVSGNTIYIAGSLIYISGVSRSTLAAVDANTYAVTPWNPAPNGSVRCILVDGDTIYLGGTFTTIGGQNRNRIAAVHASVNTNNATDWDPGCSATVYQFAKNGNTLYVAGAFAGNNSIGGAYRNRVAALNTTVNTNNATGWNPYANEEVNDIFLKDNIIYATGDFTNIGGQNRPGIAALNTSNGLATPWNLSAITSFFSCVFADGNTVYPGGQFAGINGQLWKGIAALTKTDICSASASFALSPDPTIEHNWLALNTSTGNLPITYTWYWGDGTSSTGTNPSHTYDTPGYYTICVSVTDGDGCTDSYCDNSTYIYKTSADMITINVVNQLPTDIAETENELLKIYPNPAANTITVETQKTKGIYQLIDITGKLLLNGNINSARFTLDISTVNTGIYFFSIQTDEGRTTNKIVISQ